MLGRLNRIVLAAYRWHQIGFLAGLAALIVIDIAFLEGWGTFWIMLSWSTVFGVHFMIFRAQTVDERWAHERMIFEVYRPWDTGHIEEIRNSPYGKSIYRTELGRIDKKGRDARAPEPKSGGETPDREG